MAEGKKRVIILDEKKAGGKKADRDETEKLQEELDRYAPIEDDEPVETPSVQRVHIKVRKKKKHPRLRRRIILLVLSAAVFCIVAVTAVSGVKNNYRTPVFVYQEYLNKGGYSFEEAAMAYGNGLSSRRLSKLRKVLHSYDSYMDAFYASIDESQARYDEDRSRYGDDFKYTIVINEAVALSSSECSAYTDDFEGIIEDIGSSGLARMGDDKLNLALADLTSSLDGARVTRGYRLYCTKTVKGSRADGEANVSEPCEFTVVKLKGRWIMWDSIYDIFKLSYGLPAEP